MTFSKCPSGYPDHVCTPEERCGKCRHAIQAEQERRKHTFIGILESVVEKYLTPSK